MAFNWLWTGGTVIEPARTLFLERFERDGYRPAIDHARGELRERDPVRGFPALEAVVRDYVLARLVAAGRPVPGPNDALAGFWSSNGTVPVESVEAFEIEGEVVWLVANDSNRRFVCTCREYHRPTCQAPYGHCRHITMISIAGVPLSYAVVGPLAAAFGVDATLIGAGLLGAAVTIAFMLYPRARDPERDGSLAEALPAETSVVPG